VLTQEWDIPGDTGPTGSTGVLASAYGGLGTGVESEQWYLRHLASDTFIPLTIPSAAEIDSYSANLTVVKIDEATAS
jgi:hypothetical protein